MRASRALTTQPGQVLGYRADGRPIYTIAGGAPEGGGTDGGGQAGSDGGTDPAGQPGSDGGAASGSDPSGQAGSDSGDGSGSDDSSDDGGSTYSETDVAKLRKEAGDRRTQLRQAESERDQLKGFVDKLKSVFDPDGNEDDPAKLAEQYKAEVEQKDAELRTLRVEQAVTDAASKHDADPKALNDSKAFATKTKDLDPTADGFANELDSLVKQAVESNPKLKLTQAVQRSGSEFTGGSGGGAGDKTPATGDTDAWLKHLRGEK